MSAVKVLVTGGAGYIGSVTSKLLSRAGYEVTIFDNLSTGHRELARYGELVVGDLMNAEDVEKLFAGRNFDAVVHFAALSLVGDSVKIPLWYYRHNLLGALNLLDVMHKHNVRNIVFSSTAATYGEPEGTPIVETHAKRPISPYGRSKMCIEWMLEDTSRALDIRYAALRYFNAAGADPEGECGEWHVPESHLIPNLLRTATGLEPVFRIFGSDYPTPDGTCIRDYIHVQDLASAHKLAIDYLLAGGAPQSMNLGSATGTSVRRMYDIACAVSGRKIPLEEYERRAGDPAVLVASRGKAEKLLGWKPQFENPEAMIRDAWNFYEKNGFAPKIR
mgnify:FL=1